MTIVAKTKYLPLEITPHLYRLGTPAFPVYLSIGREAALIEGGTGATYEIILDQIEEIGIEPERIRYLILTHTHADHIGAVPHLQKYLPHLMVMASPKGAAALRNERVIADFLKMDRSLTEIMLSNGEIDRRPPALETCIFNVGGCIQENDKLDLGDGLIWNFYNAPGHSACHISAYEQNEQTLVIGDSTGFYVPEKGSCWPNYFHSLRDYTDTIRKLYALPARRGLLSHNHIITDSVKLYLENAMKAAGEYHREMIDRTQKGEKPENIVREKALWVKTLTDSHPFEVMLVLARVLLERSLAEDGATFTLP